jgi:hypothetical protein
MIREQLLTWLLGNAPELTRRILEGVQEERTIQVMIKKEFLEAWSFPQV